MSTIKMNEDIKIKIISKNKGVLLANASVSFRTASFGLITIKNFQIWRSEYLNERLQEAINITPPSLHVRVSYIKLVYFESKDSWYELERLIYSEFRRLVPLNPLEAIDIDQISKEMSKSKK